MKKIFIVCVGGTICTTVKNNVRSISDDSQKVLLNNFYHSNSKFANVKDLFECGESFDILSENMTIDNWNNIISYLIKKKIDANKYCGIIFLHGTDTLAYSSALFSILLSNLNIPVFFVSSNKPLSENNSNGDVNFKYAVDCIMYGIKSGTFVTYKNTYDNKVYLHYASRLKQCELYDDNFYSSGAVDITNINNDNHKSLLSNIKEKSGASTDLIDEFKNKKMLNCVLMINPYVGLNYNSFNYDKFKAILHCTYHSGTVCVDDDGVTNNSFFVMLKDLKDSGKSVYLNGCRVDNEIYSSQKKLIQPKDCKLNINFLYGMTNEMCYTKLLIAYSLKYSKEQVLQFLKSNINNEYV